MSDEMGLDSVFDDSQEEVMGEEVTAPPAEELEEKSVGEEVTAPPAEDTPEAEEPQPDPMEEIRKEMAGLKAALSAERQKRQEAQQAAEKKDFFDDPDAAIADVEAKFEQKLTMQKVNMSEEFARARYPDFQEKYDAFAKMAESDPGLVQAAFQHSNPGEFVYQTAVKAQVMAELGDPVAYKQKLEAEIRAKVEAEMKAKAEKHKEMAGKLPPSAASIPSSGNNAEKIVVDESLEDVLG